MIMVRAPFRVSFLGGGSDLPFFYEKHEGAVLSTAIDQHMFLSGRPMFDSNQTLLKYSRIELVDDISSIEHPIFREALIEFKASGLDISVSSDIPAGTGLGSSSTFTVALVSLLAQLRSQSLTKMEIAREACRIELELLKEPIGKQDQYASALGGFNLIRFKKNGDVESQKVVLSPGDWAWLNQVLWLVKISGESRSASKLLKEIPSHASKNENVETSLKELAQLAVDGFQQITNFGISCLPDLISRSWELKRGASPSAHVEVADETISRGLTFGASAGKLLGAGGGGFVLFIVEPEDQQKFLSAFKGSKVMKVRPDDVGVTTIYSEEHK